MSIATAIQAAQQKVADAYTAASAKGATMPATQNLSNLATTIESISGGGVDTPSWINETLDANGKLVKSNTVPTFAGVKDLGDYVLSYAYYMDNSFTAINFPDLTTNSGSCSMQDAFESCDLLTSVSFPALTTISGDNCMNLAFGSCGSLTSVSFPVLTTISGGCSILDAFAYCASLASISFPALTTLSGMNCMNLAFEGCESLTSISFPSLKSNSFGSYNNQFENMLVDVIGCTIHFPSNLDPQTGSTVISSLSGYPDFGGADTVLEFDLPATE